MAGGKSSINYDERNHRFQEVIEDEDIENDFLNLSNHFDMGYEGESKMDHLNTSGLEVDEKMIPPELRMYSDN